MHWNYDKYKFRRVQIPYEDFYCICSKYEWRYQVRLVTTLCNESSDIVWQDKKNHKNKMIVNLISEHDI